MNEHPKRGEPSTVWTATIQENGDGDLLIELPVSLLRQLSWSEGDKIEFDKIEVLGDIFDDSGLTLRNLTQETDERFSGHEYETR